MIGKGLLFGLYRGVRRGRRGLQGGHIVRGDMGIRLILVGHEGNHV